MTINEAMKQVIEGLTAEQLCAAAAELGDVHKTVTTNMLVDITANMLMAFGPAQSARLLGPLMKDMMTLSATMILATRLQTATELAQAETTNVN